MNSIPMKNIVDHLKKGIFVNKLSEAKTRS